MITRFDNALLPVWLCANDDPSLADHGFRGMCVISGATFVDQSLTALSRNRVTLRNVEFTSAAIVQADERIELNGFVEFFGPECMITWRSTQVHARLLVVGAEPEPPASFDSATDMQEIEHCAARSREIGVRFMPHCEQAGTNMGHRFSRSNAGVGWRIGPILSLRSRAGFPVNGRMGSRQQRWTLVFRRWQP